jgi:asparagine synthase (glutamine-hydrolysing)
LELRVPFLDRDFVDLVMQTNPSLKRTKEEKKILRDAFEGYLPDPILRRPKDAFSDAVGYGWVDHARSHGEKVMNDATFETIQMQSDQHNVPTTKEEAWYRREFWEYYQSHNDHVISEMWRPRWTSVTDPSARKI